MMTPSLIIIIACTIINIVVLIWMLTRKRDE